jgi:hypothetical protein
MHNVGIDGRTSPGRAAHLKVFWFFFSKKNRFLLFASVKLALADPAS